MKDPIKASGSNRIVVDWDGTLVPEKWPEHPPLEKAAAEFLRWLLDWGYEVAISSTRLAPRDIDEQTILSRPSRYREFAYIRKELDGWDLQDVMIWRKPWKPGAKAYIDDKAIRFEGDWDAVREALG